MGKSGAVVLAAGCLPRRLVERRLQRSELVLDVVEQVLGVADELAVGVEVQALAECFGCAFVQGADV